VGTLDLILTRTHILAGVLVLLSGLANVVMRPKGGKWHRLVGKMYVAGMATIFLSSIAILTLFRFNLFLLVIAIFSFYMCFSGYRVLRRKKMGQQTWVDYAGAAIAGVAGAGLTLFGIYGMVIKGVDVLYILCIVFGLSTLNAVRADINAFRGRGMDDRMWWFYQHLQAMLGSYIAAVTAFAVQNGDRFAPDFEHQWLFWVVPPVVGTTCIVYMVRHYRNKHSAA
jgi:uncharacterized membrane protein